MFKLTAAVCSRCKLHLLSVRDVVFLLYLQTEQSAGTEVQRLRREIDAAKEEKASVTNALDGQRRETQHWREVSCSRKPSLQQIY